MIPPLFLFFPLPVSVQSILVDTDVFYKPFSIPFLILGTTIVVITYKTIEKTVDTMETEAKSTIDIYILYNVCIKCRYHNGIDHKGLNRE